MKGGPGSRGSSRGAVTAAAVMVASVAVGMLALAGAILILGRIPRADERAAVLAGVAAAVLTAALFQPIRARAARMLTWTSEPSAGQVLRELPARLTRDVPLEELLLQVAEVLSGSLDLGAVEVWVKRASAFERVASVPHRERTTVVVDATEQLTLANGPRRGAAWVQVWLPQLAEDGVGSPMHVVPLIDGGDVLGFIKLERAEGFAPDESTALAELARTLGLALRNATLDAALEATLDELRDQADELRRSRARIVTAADIERRRIERNIHDGVQQQIVALLSKLGLATSQLRRDPATAEQTLADLTGDTQRLLDDLRELAQGIHPSVLTDRGLLEAVETAASRLPIGVAIEASPGIRGRRFPPQVEGAAYFLVAEGLANVLKHSGASRAGIRLSANGTSLLVRVTDDGAGFDVRNAQGSGLTGLRDRIEAVGGALSIGSSPGEGTVLSAELPNAEHPR